MLTQMVDGLIQQDPTLLAWRTADTRKYIADQWNRTHDEPIDEDTLALFLCDETHSELTEEQRAFAKEKRSEMRDCYCKALFRIFLCGEMILHGMVSGTEEYRRVFLSAATSSLDGNAALCNGL